jgi:hypothetical protein
MFSGAREATFGILIGAMLTASAFAADEHVVKRFGSGTGSDAVGMVDASEDTEMSGPQAIYAGGNGQVYLLDQVNGRILQFDSRRPSEQARALELPPNLQPTDLVVSKSDIYVWDGDVHMLHAAPSQDQSTRDLEEVSTRGGPDAFTVGAFAQMGSQKPGDAADLLDADTRSVTLHKPRPRVRQMIQTHGLGNIVAEIVPERRNDRAEVELSRAGEKRPFATLKVRVHDRLGTVELLDVDHDQHVYILAENIPDTTEGQASAFVIRYTHSRPDAVYDLPLSETVALSRRFVTVSENGDVYFLRTQQGSVEVVAIGRRAFHGSGPVVGLRTRPEEGGERPQRKGPIAAVRELTRQQVIETAFAFANTRWRVNRSSYGPDPDNACTGFHRIRRPGFLAGHLDREVQGIPYCWGCFGTLNQIRLRIERGALAGNVCTRNAPRNDVVGVDCSAFVSATWGLSHHFTTIAIPSITVPLANPWELRPGDALNKPGSHVMLFLRFTPDRKAEVMEASPGACNGRVCRNVYPLSSLLARGFHPVRFRALENERMAQLLPAAEPQREAKPTQLRWKYHRRHHR